MEEAASEGAQALINLLLRVGITDPISALRHCCPQLIDLVKAQQGTYDRVDLIL